MKVLYSLYIVLAVSACTAPVEKDAGTGPIHTDTIKPVFTADSPQVATETKLPERNMPETIPAVKPPGLIDFAKTLIGVPYKFGSTEPTDGFDCSGFITYVFNHFNIEVPRSSVDFTNAGKEVEMKDATEGDLILFTGTVDSIRIVGHMGIIIENADTLKFIHSSSGRANGVTISPLTDHYKKRFVKIVRIFR